MYSASTSLFTCITWRALASSFAVIVLCNCSLAATAIVDSGGFETGYSTGALQGQLGWVTAGGGGGVASVQSSVVESGSFAVQVDRGANSDDRWAVPVGGLGHPDSRYVLVDWDMNVLATGSASAFGPFLGVDTYDDTSGPSVLGSLGVDATTGDVLYQLEGSGILAETGAVVAFDQWHHFQIRLDFLEDVYTVLLNGSPLASTGFVDGPSSSFTDADIAAFAASFDAASQSQTATGYFDNFLVRDVSRADFDIDGDVDGTDLAAWQNSYDSTEGGDADYDGDTDGADFLIWQQDFDGSVGPVLGTISSVPEPSTLVLSLVAFCFCRRARSC